MQNSNDISNQPILIDENYLSYSFTKTINNNVALDFVVNIEYETPVGYNFFYYNESIDIKNDKGQFIQNISYKSRVQPSVDMSLEDRIKSLCLGPDDFLDINFDGSYDFVIGYSNETVKNYPAYLWDNDVNLFVDVPEFDSLGRIFSDSSQQLLFGSVTDSLDPFLSTHTAYKFNGINLVQKYALAIKFNPVMYGKSVNSIDMGMKGSFRLREYEYDDNGFKVLTDTEIYQSDKIKTIIKNRKIWENFLENRLRYIAY